MKEAALLGRRTAEMHIALASEPYNPDFAPEPLSDGRRRAIAGKLKHDAAQVFALLQERAHGDAAAAADLRGVLARRGEVLRRFDAVAALPIAARSIRCHGDYHLGQVLFTGTDFVIIDFEGEPAQTLDERRHKQPAMRDVAGMLRSFHYAALAGLRRHLDDGHPGRRASLESWALLWQLETSVSFLRHYLRVASGSDLLPRDTEAIAALLDAYLLDKALYELKYELNNRPAWLPLPIQGIKQLVPGNRSGVTPQS
jgi:maltose alpha-D-glucosyltransferase/alpha-amylase